MEDDFKKVRQAFDVFLWRENSVYNRYARRDWVDLIKQMSREVVPLERPQIQFKSLNTVANAEGSEKKRTRFKVEAWVHFQELASAEQFIRAWDCKMMNPFRTEDGRAADDEQSFMMHAELNYFKFYTLEKQVYSI